MKDPRVIIIVIDACGVGELPDAAKYGDAGSSTVPHVAEAVGGLNMPCCRRLGLGNIVPIKGVGPAEHPLAAYGKMAEKSPGKDSTTGHWEMAGVVLDEPFPLFPNGFPEDLVKRFEKAAGVGTIGNIAASGTEILERLGPEHLATGKLILYTSADSVLQLAAHEKLYARDKLYQICRVARELCSGPYDVGRVIARPFIGEPGSFVRTNGRHDFSRMPTSPTLLDELSKQGDKVLAIGKIYDLFAGQGIASKVATSNNDGVMAAVADAVVGDRDHRLIFANCVDFDQWWGHRNDEVNFARALEAFDAQLEQLLPRLREDDILVITADHGCDPTIKTSTDHSREYVPLLLIGQRIVAGVNVGTRGCFADLAATLGEILGVRRTFPGKSFAGETFR